MRTAPSGLLAIASLALTVVLARVAAAAAPALASFDPAPGTITSAAVTDTIDYEALSVLQALGSQGVVSATRWRIPDASAPGGKREMSATFVDRPEDLENSHRIVLVHVSGDPESMPGSLRGIASRAILRELKTAGSTQVVLGFARGGRPGDLLGSLLASRKYYRGRLDRVEAAPVPVPVLLNGQRVMLPAVHARGSVSVGKDAGEGEFWILADERWPLLLKWSLLGATLTRVRIDTPPSIPNAAGRFGGIDLSDALAGSGCRAELHGVYFDTGSAALLSESAPAIAVVAKLLQSNPAWHVTIEGHTDSIGSADSNAALSRARASAVRDELVKRHGVDAARLAVAGFGATRPVETNATVEGRAHNRRVELSRKCPMENRS